MSNEMPDAIAVIGMAGRFPGAPNVEAFWRNLCDGVNATTFFSDEELLAAGVEPAVLSDPNYIKAKPVLDGADHFDAAFFGYTPHEAEMIDPQQRVFLECARETLENAGYAPEAYDGLIGLFGGVAVNRYATGTLFGRDLTESTTALQTLLGNDKDFLTTRVSYKLNLRGPSVDVQSACSTSLVAVALACQSLLSYSCDIALAGGVRINVPQVAGYYYTPGGVLSPDGHVRAFDARGEGIIFGNGVGIVALKRLAEALEDGDTIHAVIRGSAINNDGAHKIGYTAPGVVGQAAVIAEALAMADVEPATIGYVEAHGSGTPLGDPIEVEALTQAFRPDAVRPGNCALGSVKTNIGHLETAAGVAGLIKTILALKHRQIPPSLHFEQPNPRINFPAGPFYVNTRLAEWRTNGHPRRAGVSSFGIGGTNAHVVLEEAPAAEPGGSSRAAQLLLLSAKSTSALDTATANLCQYLAGSASGDLPDVAYTLAVGRTRFSHRRVVLCRDTEEARAALAGQAPDRMSSAVEEAGERPVAFMFPGQGGQYVDMGRELYETETVFREEVDRCAELLKPHLGLDLRTVLYPAEEQRAAAAQRLEQTELTQPAVFVMEYALARLWLSWGIRPAALAGHSLGEYAAACVAGVFTLTDALELVAARGRLMQALPPGLMLAVPLPEAEVRAMLPPGLALAVVNGPALCVVSGPIDQAEELERDLAAQGISSRRLHISHASHSAMMDPIVAPLASLIGKFRLQPPQTRLLSNVTGTWLSAAEATDPAYWARHLRQTVRFADNLAELARDPALVLLEVGPGRNLSTLARQHPGWPAQRLVLPTLRHPRETTTDAAFLLNTLGQLWLGGVPVDWPEFYAGQRRRRIPLPTYPFERQRYWIEPTLPAATSSKALAETLQKRPNLADWFYVPAWKQSLALARQASATLAKTGPWLIFRDEAWLAERLAAALSATGRVVMVSRGEKFTRLAEDVYTLDPGSPVDYATLIAELAAMGCLPRTIIHAWSVGAGEAALSEPVELEERLNLGFYSLIFLAQALGAQSGTEALEIVVLSNDMQAVGGEPALYPDKATLLGPCKVIPQDYPHLACRSIDVDLPAAGTSAAQRLIGQLLGEIATPAAERVVAYRGGRRWVQLYEPAGLPPAPEGPGRLRNQGVFLVTGGHGGISLVLAEYLARAVQARLVILGRSGFPEPELWDDWLAAHDEKDSISARIRRFREWESWGTQVWIVQADVADPVRMREVIDATRARFGALHGVIHAAGLGGGGIIQLKTRAMAAEVLRPKVHGTLVLDALLRDAGLDFMIYFSSLNAIAGKFGHVDYAAANAFLDAFAQYSANGRSIPTVSINWDLWDRIGMAERIKLPSMLEGWREEQFRLGITPDEGVEVFRRILALEDAPQILVSTADFAAVQAQAQAYTQSVILNALDRLQSSSGKRPRPALATAYVAPRDEVEQSIAEIWQNQLGYQPIGVDDNFFDLGGDSLLAIQMSPQVSKALNVTFSVQSLLETPTVAGVAHAIREARRSQEEARIAALLADVEQLSDENVQQLLAEQRGLEVA